MLVLNRKTGEVIRIGDSIQIKVVEIRGNIARLGIDCPKEIPVYREEVYNKIKAAPGKE